MIFVATVRNFIGVKCVRIEKVEKERKQRRQGVKKGADREVPS